MNSILRFSTQKELFTIDHFCTQINRNVLFYFSIKSVFRSAPALTEASNPIRSMRLASKFDVLFILRSLPIDFSSFIFWRKSATTFVVLHLYKSQCLIEKFETKLNKLVVKFICLFFSHFAFVIIICIECIICIRFHFPFIYPQVS